MKNRPLIIGVAAAVLTIAIGVGLILAITADDESAGGSSDASTVDTRRSSTSTTSRSSTTTTSKAGGASSTVPAGPGPTPTIPVPDAPEPPDPVDRYNPVALPPGISATIASCGWTPDRGGELRASGTVTNFGSDEDVWFVDVYWLVWNQTQNEDIDSQTEIYDIAVGQTIPWDLSISAPTGPPNLSCALEVG